jgi:hypothetical protein
LELPYSHEQELTLENLVEIQKQNTLEKSEEPEPGPEGRAATVSKLRVLDLWTLASGCLRASIRMSS